MRICHLVGRSHRRGAERVAFELAEELDGLGHTNRLLAVEPGHLGERDERLAPLVARRRLGPLGLAMAAARLRRDLRARPVDVVLAHGGSAAQVACLAKGRSGPKIVWQRILGLPPGGFGPLRRSWWRLIVQRLDGVVALTDDMATELGALGYRGPAWVVPNARSTRRFEAIDRAAAGQRLRAELGVGTDVALLGLVGHLVEQKQPLHAVEVLAELRRLRVDAHLVVAGSGPLTPSVGERARTVGVLERTSLMGHRDDVPDVLAGLDVLVLTSREEGIPGVVIEAAMAGCPVVSYPLGGVGDVVEDGVSGLILDEAEPHTMARAVADLLGDGPRRRAMADATRAGSGRFSMSATARLYEAHLTELSSS